MQAIPSGDVLPLVEQMFSYLFLNMKSAIKKFTLYLLPINKNAIFYLFFL